ncbi:MAG: pantoate--beta-alanine ligase [Bacteroidetes bacterium]|nr:pantoate--beta-alanine ligase [Bacteroidota bacterium]
MLIIETTAKGLQKLLDEPVSHGSTVGFVPTMGALHAGHVSLVETAKTANDIVVASIFVNPTQFNDPKDLSNYPRTIEADKILLEKAGCDILFLPSVEEMYPTPELLEMDFGLLENVMEGAFRPGHFRGMATVVSKFFNMVNPDTAYFGEKDFQQLAIIREMNRRQLNGIEIVGCETLREANGLAMSSRNIHLTDDERSKSGIIYKALQQAVAIFPEKGAVFTSNLVKQMIEEVDSFKVQYLEFVDSTSLQPIEQRHPGKEERVCVAVLTSKTRLIDNIAL